MDIIVATPGRLLQLLQKKNSVLNLDRVQNFILDECDRMLNMGFIADIRDIHSYIPKPPPGSEPKPSFTTRIQTLLYTATLVPKVQEFIKALVPNHFLCNLNKEIDSAKEVEHLLFLVTARKKHALLKYLCKRKGKLSLKDKQALIFCRTRQRVERLAAQLSEEDGLNAKSIHKGLSISKRETIIEEFREGKIQLLVATDVMARGIDIPYLPFVINYDVPNIPEDYIHRIGRTGRAGNTGMALTFVSKEPQIIEIGKNLTEINELQYIFSIERLLKKRIRIGKVPGPWKDEGNEDPSTNFQEKKLEKLKELKTKKVKQGDKKFLNKSKKKGMSEKTSLRIFEEGRYENIIQKFEVKRALNRGAVSHGKKKRISLNPNTVQNYLDQQV